MWDKEALISCWTLILLLALAGCGTGTDDSVLTGAFPPAGDVPGWMPDGDVRTFDEETLFDLVNGQADAFFVYGFERAATRRYVGADEAKIHVEVWQLTTPADAYGLFTANVAGTPVAGFGNDGDADPGRRLTFWQNRYFVNVRALQETDNAELETFARYTSSALPAGGSPPDLLDRLPPDGLAARPRFFHEEISIQDVLWLGGENLLSLSPETDGLLARYERDGTNGCLLLVAYPDAAGAADARAALENASVGDLIAADADDRHLAAVFGQVDEVTAGTLVAQALGGE